MATTSLERALEESMPIENFGQSSAFQLLEALEDLNDEDLAAMHEKLGLSAKAGPKPMPAAARAKHSAPVRKPAAAAAASRPRRSSSADRSRSASPPRAIAPSRGGRGGRGGPPTRGAPVAARGRGADRGRGAARGGDRGRGARGGRGGKGGADENKKPVGRPLFEKPLRPPGNIWKLTFSQIMSSNTILGEIVHKLYAEEKKKLDAEAAIKKAEAERKRQEELAQKLLEQKRKEEEARERAKFITPATVAAPPVAGEEAKEKEDGGEEKKKRRRPGKKKDEAVAKPAPDVSMPKEEEKLDMEAYLRDLRQRVERGEMTKYEYEEQAKALAGATQVEPAAKKGPNYFIGIRCKAKEVLAAAEALQQRAVSLCEELRDSIVPIQRLHVTLVMLALHTPEQVKQATALMFNCVLPLIKEHFPTGVMELTFDRVGHFGNRVLWIGPAADDNREKLLTLRNAIERIFIEAKLATEDDEYKPHGTLMKGNVRIPDTVVEELASSACGTQNFDFVELMPIGKYDKSGNYLSTASCNVRPLTEEEEKNRLGELIFAKVSEEHPAVAGKITGMLLDSHSNAELSTILTAPSEFGALVTEALAVLHQAEEEAAQQKKKKDVAPDSESVVSEAPPSDVGSVEPWQPDAGGVPINDWKPGAGEINFEEYLWVHGHARVPEHLRLQAPRPPNDPHGASPGVFTETNVAKWPGVFNGPRLRVGRYVY